jgi:hypothetical protein
VLTAEPIYYGTAAVLEEVYKPFLKVDMVKFMLLNLLSGK